MKKVISLVLLILCFGVMPTISANEEVVQMAQELGYPATDDIAPRASLVIDADTGQIIWGHDIDLQWNPASISKLMTVYLLYDAMTEGTFDENTLIEATETDEAISQIYALSNNKIVAGVSYPIGDLIKASLVQSSNAAIFMLSNYLAPNDHSDFIDKMNEKARELGMSNTRFFNSGGAEAKDYGGLYHPDRYDLTATNQMTARDAAILAYRLLKDYPQVLEHTSAYQPRIMAGTPYEEELHSYNMSLPGGKYFLEGVDGLKTGSSEDVGYNAVFTAQRDGQRYIAVVLGVSEWENPDGQEQRHYFLNGLLHYAFEQYQPRLILGTGKQKIGDSYYDVTAPLVAYLTKGESVGDIVADKKNLILSNKETIYGHLAVTAEPITGVLEKLQAVSEIADREGRFNWVRFILILLSTLMVLTGLIVIFKERIRHKTL